MCLLCFMWLIPSLPEEAAEDALLLGRSGTTLHEEEVVLGAVVDAVGSS